jgi:pyridoxine 5'-phosphate synthase PdxJ
MLAAVDTKLSVNLNKVALLRNQRDIGYPSVLDAARLVVRAGAHGITVHPRPDERHVRRADVTELAALLRDELPPAIELNIEGYPTPEFIALGDEVRPDQVTLVPDAPDQRTSDHGWDLSDSPGRPEVTEMAPYDTPDAPVARPTPRESMKSWRRSGECRETSIRRA